MSSKSPPISSPNTDTTSQDPSSTGAHPPTPIFIHSIWLLPAPSSPSHSQVSSLLDELRTDSNWETSGSPEFGGHVTLCGGIGVDEKVDGEGGLGEKIEKVLEHWSDGMKERPVGNVQSGGEREDILLKLEMAEPLAMNTYHTSLVQPVRTDSPPSTSSSDSVALLRLNARLSKSLPLIFPPSPSYPFFPHLSLAYTSLPLLVRQDIARRLTEQGKALKSVRFARVALMKCVGAVGDGGWEEIGRWDLRGRKVEIGL